MRNSPAFTTYIYRLVDVGIIYFTGFLALQLRFWNAAIPNDSYNSFIIGACLIYLFASSGLSTRSSAPSFIELASKITKLWAITCLVVLLLIIFTQSGNLLSRIWLTLWMPLTWFTLIFGHFTISYFFWRLYSRRLAKKRVAIIGAGTVAQQLIEQIKSGSNTEFELLTLIGNTQDAAAIEDLSKQLLDEIWVALPIDETNRLPTIINQLRLSPASIKYAPDLFTLRLINHGSTEVLGVNMLNLNASPFSGEAFLLKNLEDLIISFLLIIFLSPLLLALAIAVKLTSPGPILYKQQRVGLNGRPFMMLKFRSMPADIEREGVRWGNSEGKTVHPFCRWMRRLNLDELPQFFNVLLGQMSIVGPRPERVEFIEKFSQEVPNYAKKHLVKAGITGWAQIHGLRGDTDLSKRIEYDLYYIENWSLSLDLKIILMTAFQSFIHKPLDQAS